MSAGRRRSCTGAAFYALGRLLAQRGDGEAIGALAPYWNARELDRPRVTGEQRGSLL